MILALVISGCLGLALVVWGLCLWFRKPSTDYGAYPQTEVTVGGQTFRAVVADTVARRSQGLSGREWMGADEGMLFVFPIAARYSFWMKDMRFPLDLIWIADGRIADISADVPAPAPDIRLIRQQTFRPQAKITTVLEVNAGLAARYGWKIGDPVQIGDPAKVVIK